METVRAIDTPENVCGVYKITFDNKWFYIGCSINLKRRFFVWEHKFRTKKSKNPLIQQVLNVASIMQIEILELTASHNEALFKEAFYISFNSSSQNCLNIVGRGVKEFGATDTRQKVAAFTKTGEYLCTYNSIADAEKVFGRTQVGEFFSGKSMSVKNCTFKKVDADGNFIDFQIRSKKKRAFAHRDGRPIDKFDMNGNFIKRIDKVIDAAREAGVTKCIIWRVLTGKRKQHRGFIYRYA